MTQKIVSIYDGDQTTVRDLVGNPLWIPARIVELITDLFIEEALLRNAGPNPNGLVGYETSTPLFLDDDLATLVEFEEIPVGTGQRGARQIAVALRQALGVRISKEMIDENRIGDVNRQITQLVNTLVRSRARALRALLNDPSIPTLPAGAAWDTSTGRPRRDIANAMEIIGSAKVTPTSDDEDEFGFAADTIAMSTALTPVLMDNDNFVDVYKAGDAHASEDIRYTGKLPGSVLGLAGLQSRFFTSTDRVLVLERNTVGFYSDTRPFQVTEVYPEGNGPNGGPNESYRSDASGKRAMGIDQPLAACWITGVTTP